MAGGHRHQQQRPALGARLGGNDARKRDPELKHWADIDWPYIYGRIITVTGWPWEYIDYEMTLERVLVLLQYWIEHPPLHDLKAAQLGYSKKRGKGRFTSDPHGFLNEARASGFQGTRAMEPIPVEVQEMMRKQKNGR